MNLDVAGVASLAQLDLTPEESLAMQRDLAAILEYIAQLQRIPTDGVAPMSHPLAAAGCAETPLREDQARRWFSPAEAVANAPAQTANMFSVPKVIDREGGDLRG